MSLSAAEGAVLVLVGLAAGFVNTVAGGGSLLTLPALMILGLDAVAANATNRLAILAQSLGAAGAFRRAGTLRGLPVASLGAPVVAGAGAGAVCASATPAEYLEPILLATLVAMAAWMALMPRGGLAAASAEVPRPTPRTVLALGACGFYGGFLQAGVGFALVAVLTGLLRLDLVRATALKVLVIGALTVIALVIFAAAGQVRWEPGAWMAAGQAAGGLLGARLALAKGAAVLRWLVLAGVVASALAVALR